MACSEPVEDAAVNSNMATPILPTAPFNTDSGNILLRCGTLIDGRSNNSLNNVSVLIENGRFSKIAKHIDVPAGFLTLDLSDHTCLPGLIDMHTHMLESFEELVDLTMYYDYSHDDYMSAGRKYSQLSINAGFTSVRNLGNYYAWVYPVL